VADRTSFSCFMTRPAPIISVKHPMITAVMMMANSIETVPSSDHRQRGRTLPLRAC
jgi:hypothetical protein